MDLDSEVFLSWSGDASRQIAEKLRGWLPLLLDSLKLWISSEDLQEGTRWSTKLFEHLEKSNLGIFIVTPENCTAPWMMFEAGALSKNLDRGRVVPYMVGFTAASQLQGPLKHFQSTRADKEGTLKLVKAINKSLPVKTEPAVIEGRFEHLWPSLDTFLSSICLDEKKNSNLVTANRLDDAARLEVQLSEMREMMRQLVNTWTPRQNSNRELSEDFSELEELQGAWHDVLSNSHFYLRIINGQLYAPYCYAGNTHLVGTLYNWQKLGEYWFARFQWVHDVDVCGFLFLKQISSDTVQSSWCSCDLKEADKKEPEGIENFSNGHHGVWKYSGTLVPDWANAYFTEKLAESSSQN